MLTIQDEKRVRTIVQEEIIELKIEVRRNSVLLENLDHRILAIAENVSAAMENSMRINNIDERLVVVEHLNGIAS